MTGLLRWWRFNLVGAMGMVLQLTAVAVLNRLTGGRYLLASAAAIELTLMHNFIWHVRYTWSDRSEGAGTLIQLLRFHLSNGLVSMLGSFALMPLFVRSAHLPAVPANAIVVVCCSLVNFALGHNWAFATPEAEADHCVPLNAAAPIRCESRQ